jgi:hypothetical protein
LGFKTAGNQLNGAFSKGTVRGILTNRFYPGEIPDGDDGWLPGSMNLLLNRNLGTAFSWPVNAIELPLVAELPETSALPHLQA